MAAVPPPPTPAAAPELQSQLRDVDDCIAQTLNNAAAHIVMNILSPAATPVAML